MTDEPQGAPAPETTTDTVVESETPGSPAVTLTAEEVASAQASLDQQAADVAAAGPTVEGVDAWAASLTAMINDPTDTSPATVATWVTNCLRDGYAQGKKAAQALRFTVFPPTQESILEHIEDEAIRAAEEVAYAASNLTAEALGRKPYNGIADWKERTGGLFRHRSAA